MIKQITPFALQKSSTKYIFKMCILQVEDGLHNIAPTCSNHHLSEHSVLSLFCSVPFPIFLSSHSFTFCIDEGFTLPSICPLNYMYTITKRLSRLSSWY